MKADIGLIGLAVMEVAEEAEGAGPHEPDPLATETESSAAAA